MAYSKNNLLLLIGVTGTYINVQKLYFMLEFAFRLQLICIVSNKNYELMITFTMDE